MSQLLDYMHNHTHTLYTILKHFYCGESIIDESDYRLNNNQWRELYNTSVQQGVSAIVFDKISTLPREIAPPNNIKLQWAIHAKNIEYRTQKQLQIANELTDIFKTNNLKTVVLKGFGLGIYYPNPSHRECGDFDCFLFDNYEKAIEIAKANGAKVEHIDYKHTRLLYKGINIEIHKHFTSYRGDKVKQEFERILNSLIRDEPCTHIDKESNILTAAPTFNAIFFIYHALFHFLIEGIKLRHILDWGFMVKSEQNSIKWDVFTRICTDYKMLKFVEIITIICNDYFGMNLSIPINRGYEYRDKVLLDIMSDTNRISCKKGWNRRSQLLINTFKARWKFRIIDTRYTAYLTKLIFYFIFSDDKFKTS